MAKEQLKYKKKEVDDKLERECIQKRAKKISCDEKMCEAYGTAECIHPEKTNSGWHYYSF